MIKLSINGKSYSYEGDAIESLTGEEISGIPIKGLV
jgi:hypothetical protein